MYLMKKKLKIKTNNNMNNVHKLKYSKTLSSHKEKILHK